MRDLRKYASQTQTRFLIGFFILLFTVGLGLIYVIYGSQAAILGLVCLLGVLIPISVVVLLLNLIERSVNKHGK